jgi:hypothetical protein
MQEALAQRLPRAFAAGFFAASMGLRAGACGAGFFAVAFFIGSSSLRTLHVAALESVWRACTSNRLWDARVSDLLVDQAVVVSDWRLVMDKVITALIGGALGLGAVWLGMRLNFGAWYIDGPWGYVGAAVGGALIALLVRYAMRKEFGWP